MKRCKIISFGIQKGGAGKTTTSSIVAWLLANQGNKVLAIDFDSQGNMTQMLSTTDIYEFTGKTVLQALKEKNPVPYIHEITENLHLLPAEDFLSQFAHYIWREYYGKGDPNLVLKETIDVVKDQYDFIIIDLPPNLGEQTRNGLAASDFAVMALKVEPFCVMALDRYVEFLIAVKDNVNPNLELAGILPLMLKSRRKKHKEIIELVRKEYGDLIFNTIIKDVARIEDFSDEGITDRTKVDRDALEQYNEFIKELLQRVNQ